MNPAEFLADLISIDYSSSESVYASQKRIDGLVESFSEQISEVLYATPLLRDSSKTRVNLTKKSISRKGGWWRQFWLLLKRAWMQVSSISLSNSLPISLLCFNRNLRIIHSDLTQLLH